MFNTFHTTKRELLAETCVSLTVGHVIIRFSEVVNCPMRITCEHISKFPYLYICSHKKDIFNIDLEYSVCSI